MYPVTLIESVVTDGQGIDIWLHDLPKDTEELRIQALVASGDYFETLAAHLEQVAATLPVASIEQYQLQDTVTQLLYLQRKYAIVKRSLG